MRQLKPNVQIALLLGAAAAGITTVTSSTLDTSNGDSFSALLNVGNIAAGGTLTFKVMAGDLADGSDKADIPGASLALTTADANKAAMIGIHRPPKRYLTVVVSRANANSDIVSIQGFVYGVYKEPVEQPGIGQSIALVSPEMA